MRKALALGTAAVALLGSAGAASAQTAADTADTTVSATVAAANLGGGRTLAVTTAPVLASVAGGTAGTMAVAVTETLARGVNPWSVSAELTADLTSGSATLGKANLATTSNTVVETAALTGVDVVEGAPADFSSAVELMQVDGQATTSTYTNVYAISTGLSLNLPSGTQDGVYTAPMTVTLWQ